MPSTPRGVHFNVRNLSGRFSDFFQQSSSNIKQFCAEANAIIQSSSPRAKPSMLVRTQSFRTAGRIIQKDGTLSKHATLLLVAKDDWNFHLNILRADTNKKKAALISRGCTIHPEAIEALLEQMSVPDVIQYLKTRGWSPILPDTTATKYTLPSKSEEVEPKLSRRRLARRTDSMKSSFREWFGSKRIK